MTHIWLLIVTSFASVTSNILVILMKIGEIIDLLCVFFHWFITCCLSLIIYVSNQLSVKIVQNLQEKIQICDTFNLIVAIVIRIIYFFSYLEQKKGYIFIEMLEEMGRYGKITSSPCQKLCQLYWIAMPILFSHF